jgi:hypothetical protein
MKRGQSDGEYAEMKHQELLLKVWREGAGSADGEVHAGYSYS